MPLLDHSPAALMHRLSRLGAAFTLTALSILAAISYIGDRGLSAQSQAAQSVNLLGRQRMLAQHVGLDASRLCALDATPAERMELRNQLRRGLDALETARLQLAEVREKAPDLFMEKEFHLRHFLLDARALLQASEPQLRPDNPHLRNMVGLLELENGALIHALDRVTHAYADQARAGVGQLQTTRALGLSLIGLFILAMAVLVFRPLILALRRGMDALTNSEQRHHVLLEALHDGMIVIDEHGSIQSFNKAAEHIFGYPQEEVLSRNINILMPEPYHSAHDGYIRNYLASGQRRIIGIGREVRGRRKDGTTFPMDLAVTEMHLQGKRLFTGIVRDISERQQLMERLRMQGAVLESVANAVMITDARGRITWTNRAFTTLTGYTAEEALGRDPRLLKSGSQDDRVYADIWETLVSGRVWHGEIINRRSNGEDYFEEQTITPLRDEQGSISHYIAIKQDVSARKRDEQAIADQACAIQASANFEHTQSRILSLFSGGHDRQAILNETLVILAEAQRYPVLAIYLYDEWSGTLNQAAAYGMPGDSPRELAPNQGLPGQAAATGKLLKVEAPEAMPLRIETGLFPVVPAGVIASPILFRDQVLGVIVVASLEPFHERDCEFIERLCGQIGVALNTIRQYQDLKTLSEQLKQRGREIADKNAQLEQANRLKSEFLANMSHELRTPLNAVIGFSEVLKDGLMGELSAPQLDYVGEIFASANHLLSLINDILDLSKIEAGKMELHLEPVNVPEMLRNALSVVKEKAHAHGIRLDLELAEGVGIVQADGRKVKQVIYNLLSNAVKFTPDAGRVWVEAHMQGPRLRVEVGDTGIGIPADKLDRLFRPFEQIDGSLSRKYEGTGLGLAMVKRLVELHGGKVWVHSEPGRGSCFGFDLPAPAEPPALRATPELQAAEACPAGDGMTGDDAPHRTTPTVLLVENDDAAAELLGRHLDGAGYRVMRARGGSECLDMAAAYRPDLFVVDIILPDFDGWEIMRRLKQDPGLAGIPVLVVSILADTRHGLELGAVDLLEKPVRKSVLLEAVRRALPDPKDAVPIQRVLVVDDDPGAVDFVTLHLAGAGCEVLKAYGGRQAIELALSELPDLIVLDLMMPEVTGFDVVAALRREDRAADIPVLILTAKMLSEEDRRRLTETVSQVLSKSEFNPQAFMADVARVMARHQARSGGMDEPASRRSRILVVEDDPDQADLLKLYLEDAGYAVTLAASGRDAMAEMQRRPPDLISLDLLMPDMNGFVFLEAKSQDPILAPIPVMVLSAVADQLEGTPLAADAILRKPIRRTELLHTLETILPPGRSVGRARLLLVDDDPKALKIVSSYLPLDRFEVLTAMSGGDALELTRHERPDLILLDLMMPDMSGFDVLAALKRDDDTRAIPIIVLTAKLLTRPEQQRLEDQVAAIAVKGKASREKLLHEIDRILRRYRL